MKILHTADWHLGRTLYGKTRYREFSEFLDWLLETIAHEKVDILLVAGDIFDTTTPSNRSQELYYRFLCRVANSCCRHVVVIAGNHDSPSFLDAPKELLRVLNVHVVGSLCEDITKEVIVLKKESKDNFLERVESETITADEQYTIKRNEVEAIICAVPYLRDRDIRTAQPGETIEDKNRNLIEGIKNHYVRVVAHAEELRRNFQSTLGLDEKPIPIIAMGHLFTQGGKTMDDDGVRELYVGSLARVSDEVFPNAIDYLALGHLHVPQAVGNTKHIRYSGSPIPIGFGEAGQQKMALLLDFDHALPREGSENGQGQIISKRNSCSFAIQEISIPRFQKLIRISGNFEEIDAKLHHLKSDNSTAWIEVEYTGNDTIPDLRERLYEQIAGTELEILRIRNERIINRVHRSIQDEETLENLGPEDIFSRCLDACQISESEREELTVSYQEILREIQERDRFAE